MRKLGIAFCVGGVAICAYCGGRVAFVGDSITHDGRYLAYLQLMEQFDHPDDPDIYFNAGVSGDTAFDGRNRWSDDVLQMKPTSVFVMMGMNDVKRELWQRVNPTDDVEARNRQTALDSCCTNLAALCALAKRDVGNVTLMTPTPYDSYGAYETANLTGCNEPQGLSAIAEFVRLLANREHVGLVELHRRITAVLRENPELKLWGTDRVHPQNEGHLLMAALIRSAMVGTSDVSRVEVDAGGKEDLTFGYCPERLPFPNVREVKAVDAVYPFTENFNREILVVRNLPTGNYELLSEGKHLAEFSAAQLAAGVNLSEVDTPNAARARDAYDRMMRYRGWINTCRRLAVARKLIRKAGGGPSNYKEALKCADAWCAAHKDEPWFPASGAAIEVWKRREPLKDKDAKEGERLLREALSVCRPIAFDITIRKTERHSFGAGTNDLARFVDPFVGCADNGHCFAAAAYPMGMVQAGPDTGNTWWDYCSGYRFADTNIIGFSQTHLSGTGCGDLGDVRILPCGEEGLKCLRGLRSLRSLRGAGDLAYAKSEEVAEPGYYAVTLKDAAVRVEIAAAKHAAIYRFKSLDADLPRLLVDLQYGILNWSDKTGTDRVISCEVRREGDCRIVGSMRTKMWVERVFHFVLDFNRPIAAREDLPKRDERERGRRFVLGFEGKGEGPLMMRFGISANSVAAAKANLSAEIPGWDFAAVRTATREAWNRILSRVEIEGTDEQKRTFYTSLYHLYIQPNDIADVGCEPYYSTFSTWDTFRAAHPLYTILSPEYVDGFVNSMLKDWKKHGYLPIWTLWGEDNQCMIGTHSVPIIVDWFLKSGGGPLRTTGPTVAVDWQEAYAAVKDTLTRKHGGRSFEPWDMLERYGYVPFDKVGSESVSRTLEFAYDDWCAARFAEALDKKEDALFFDRRAFAWTNVFDRTTCLMRGRDSSGNWRTPFNPFKLNVGGNGEGAKDFTEGNSWQYSWHVMQHPQELIALHGGREKFADHLDRLFSLPEKAEGMGFALDATGLIGQYAHGNEPSHHTAYFFSLAGRPDRTAEIVREVCDRFYRPQPDGLCGNDDCGQMSAWYLFSAMGFYPFNPCRGEYVIGAPQVSKVTLRVCSSSSKSESENGIANIHSTTTTSNYDSFTIIAKGLSKENKYVKSVTLNGKPIADWKIRHEDIVKGGELVFEMGEK